MASATLSAEHPPPVEFGVGKDGESVAYVGSFRVDSLAGLLGRAPHLATAANATDLAQAANHFVHGADFRVITDPQAFADAYRRRLAAEDPDVDWQENVARLCDFGVPDFAEITPPVLRDGRLSYFAADVWLGVPYKAVLDRLDQTPEYAPLPLTPVARHAQPSDADATQHAERFTDW